LATKTGLIHCLKNYYHSIGKHIFDSIATSYILEIGKIKSDYFNFSQRYKELSRKLYWKERTPSKHCQKNLWLLKPANMNQGRGISMVKNLKELRQRLTSKNNRSLWVLQKYIERPLLYHNRKFDIRVWVLVTDSADVLLYKDGYIRTSSELYDLSSSASQIHLTNNCLQVNGTNYSKHEPGNTLSYDVFRKYLEVTYQNCETKPDLDRDIIPRMKDLIIDTIMSVKSGLISSEKTRGTAFEFLGYDFMVDEDLRVWLIEVNDNPYIGVPNDYIRGLLPIMLDSLFSLVLDRIYPPTNKIRSENRFEVIYCEELSRFSNKPINQRRPFDKSLLYPIKELTKQNEEVQEDVLLLENEVREMVEKRDLDLLLKKMLKTVIRLAQRYNNEDDLIKVFKLIHFRQLEY